MPGDKKHHTEKFRRCVEQVLGKGHEESAAYAICTTSLQNAGEPIFEAAADGSELFPINMDRALESSETRTLHLLGATGKVRYEMLNDRRHFVVPVVALMEGVIHAVNADTPEFVSSEVLKRAAASWVGKPVTLGHPAKAGKQCSAVDPEIRKATGVGVLMKSEWDGKRLAQEAWIDEEKARRLHPEMHKVLADGGVLEVSVGAHVVTIPRGGDYNGKQYKATWAETQGDHLAFLPGGRGACSCDMGCGTHRAAMHLVTAESIQPMVVETLKALADKSLDEMFETMRAWMESYRAAQKVEPPEPPKVEFPIRHEGGKWSLYSRDGSRKLAEHLTKGEVEAHATAIRAALAHT